MNKWIMVTLTLIFASAACLTASAAFFYPLEIEGRESTVWLAALALKAGINIYDQSKVVFVNLNHGPFDPLFKSVIATTFSFLESWQVTRLPVFILPFMFLFLAWKMIGRSAVGSLLHALFAGSIGYLFLLVSAKEFLFVGRSDSTVAMLLLILLYISIALYAKTPLPAALQGFFSGLLAILVVLTNWRTGPTALAILLFTFWKLRIDNQTSRGLTGIYIGSCAVASVITLGLMLYHVSNLDLAVFYQYFFGFYSNAAGWAAGASYNGPIFTFVLSLFDPTASPTSLKGGPLLLTLFTCVLVLSKSDLVDKGNMAWLILAAFSFVFCAIAYYLNYWGGGSWYFIPFVIILWFFLCINYLSISQARLNLLGIFVLALLCINFRTAIAPTISRVSTFRQAETFIASVRSLQEKGSIVSEDTFFFRTRYAGELIDMGDTVSVFAKSGYFGAEFKYTAQRHFDRVRSNPPDYIVTVFRGSPELRTLIEDKYVLLANGPANLTANGRGETKLFMRKELLSERGPAQGLEKVGLYGVWEFRVANLRKYQNPFDFTEIELQATFTAPSGKRIKFFGFYDGDGSGNQKGNVWKLRFMPDELGTWKYSYTWTDNTPGGSGTFTVVDNGLAGPLKIAGDRSWFFMTSRGHPFHARPYGMQDYGPRIKSSTGWERNSQEYIDVLKANVIARGYNMVMSSGPNRFEEGRSYWWQNKKDIFDIAVWREYEKVLRYALDNRIYLFPFDGMAEQSAFGMPLSRFTKYIGRFIPFFDRPVGRVTPAFKRYMVARYGAFASFMGYSPTWEWPEFWSESTANKFMSEIRQWNPFPTLLTAHDSSRASFEGWMGFSMRQASWEATDIFGGNCRACGHHGGVQPPFDNMPILGSEEIWEAPATDTYGYPKNTAQIRRAAWGAMMAGVMPVYSEWYWDFFMGNGRGEAEVRRMFDFVYSKTRYRHYRQLNHLVSRPARQIASGIPAEEYLVYDEDGGVITIDLSSASSATVFSSLWFDPKTGVEQTGENIDGGNVKTLKSPFSGDTVLLLRISTARQAPIAA